MKLIKFIMSLFKPKQCEWKDGYPPSSLSSSFYVTGMRLDEKYPAGIFPIWKYSPPITLI